MQTMLDVADNTGAKRAMCIKVLGGTHRRYARLGDIIVGHTRDREPVRCRDLKADGAMAVLLKDALKPNLVQTLENNPAFIHGGPFANIAHGCNTVLVYRKWVLLG